MKVDSRFGLTDEQVIERINNKQNNYDTTIETKSVKDIFKTNICTLFNFLNLFLAFLVLLVGSYKNLLFLGTIFCNTFIGIIQELRSKITIDKLSFISIKNVKVIRNGKENVIGINDIVIDDIVKLTSGNQIVVDSIVVDGEIEVNESLITGEIEPIKKHVGDSVLSGSFVVSGDALVQVEHVALDNYTYKISKDAKYLKPIKSEIMISMKKIIKFISYIIIPVGIAFFIKQINVSGNSINSAVINTVAALIAIIPDGLMLLTSTVMAISVIKLSNHKVLVQQLYCIESLARVDTICFDKTGTLTKGLMQVTDFISFKDFDLEVISEMCYHLNNHNATMNAITEKYGASCKRTLNHKVAFSSSRKWSGVSFMDGMSYVIGAPDFIIKNYDDDVLKVMDKYGSSNRVIMLAQSKSDFIDDKLPLDLEPLGVFIIEDVLRDEAKDTIDFFLSNDVNVKIISGDSAKMVSRIAKKLDLSFADSYIDTTGMSFEDLRLIANKYSIFGRVTPDGKKVLIEAMQGNGHVVAMTGDGVNDVLALKQADCAIAVASGTDAARNVADLVLLNSNFTSIPKIVAEGRRTINNIERSASLFITKTLYALLLLVLFMFVDMAYPFMPIQLTLTSTFTIGIPAFILALEPNHDRVKGKFLLNVVSVSVPTAVTIVFNIVILIVTSGLVSLSNQDISTLSVLLVATTGFMHIYRISRPLNIIRGTLLIVLVLSFLILVFGFKTLFSLSIISNGILAIYLILFLFSFLFFNIITKVFENYIYRKN